MAQDKVGMEEIQKSLPTHEDNQKRFGLPTKTIAKVFLYRMIFANAFGPQGYGGPAFSYANDSDFLVAGLSKKKWVGVIEKFFDKYEGVHEHSIGLIRAATTDGQLVIPTGRYYPIAPIQTPRGPEWPNTQILNYPIQGFSADIVLQARLLAWKWVRALGYGVRALFINTVHDSIEMDVDNDPELVYTICITLRDCFRKVDVPLKQKYGVNLNVPMDGECKFGMNGFDAEMAKFNEADFEQKYKEIISK